MSSRGESAAYHTISGSNLRAGRDNIVKNEYHNRILAANPNPLALLQQHAALGALHNAAERPDPPKCHEVTRIAILARIDHWVRDRSEQAKSILWLAGAAGAGKSAIAQTLIERWLEKNILICPNFFFWRTSAERNMKTRLISTLAFQLANMLPETRSYIARAVQDGSIFEQSLKAQVQHLIVDPLITVNQSFARRVIQALCTPLGINPDWFISPHFEERVRPICIVIDGLDECCVNLPRGGGFPGQSYEDQQREILEAIAFACRKIPFLRVLVACRPERQIRISFAGSNLADLSLALSLNDERDSSTDIALYLEYEFKEIRCQYPGLNPMWPSPTQISRLVQKSSEQFIYPATVIKYISRRRQFPVKSLDEVLALQAMQGRKDGHPLAELDALYSLVLGAVHRDSWATVKMLLGIMCFTSVASSALSVNHTHSHGPTLPDMFRDVEVDFTTLYLSHFLFLEEGELLSHLTDLHSILSISIPESNGSTNRLKFHHATLSEYLSDQSRSGEFYVDKDATHLQCTLHLLKHAELALHAGPNSLYYIQQSKLYTSLSGFLACSSPSKDVMETLWTLLKGDIGEYSEITISTLISVGFCIGNGMGPRLGGPIFNFVDGKDQLQLLQYLQRCNTPEFEPSSLQEEAIAKHLWYLINDIVEMHGIPDTSQDADASRPRDMQIIPSIIISPPPETVKSLPSEG